MIRYADYMKCLYDAMLGVTDAVYIKDRPQAVSKRTKTFCVVDVSNWIRNKEIDNGGDFDWYNAIVYISLFVRDKETSDAVNQLDIMKMDELIKKTEAKFPIERRDLNVKICNPRMLVSTSDENGFHYTLISASLTTYF